MYLNETISSSGYHESNSSGHSITLLVIFFLVSILMSALCAIVYWVIVTHQKELSKYNQARIQSLQSISLISSSTFCWFAISISFTLFNKWFMTIWRTGFHFPILTTAIHMLLKFLISRVWLLFYSNRTVPLPNLDWTTTFKLVIPIGALTAFDVMLSNMSILYIPLSLYTALKASVPLWSFLCGILLEIETPSCQAFFPLVFLSAGLSLAVLSSTEALSSLGIVLCLGAAAAGGCRWALLQKLVAVDSASQSIMVAIYRFAPASTLTLVPFVLIFEIPALSQSVFVKSTSVFLTAISITFAGGVIAFFLICVELFLLVLTSSVTLSVLGQLKEVFQIALSLVVFKEKFSAKSCLGLAVSLVAANYYRQFRRAHFSLVEKDEGGRESGKSSSYERISLSEIELDDVFTTTAHEDDNDVLF